MPPVASSRVTKPGGVVVLAFEPQPLSFFDPACKLCGPDAVFDPDVARMAGANLAAGSRGALDALHARLAAGVLDASRQETRGLALPPGAADWLAVGNRGMSSDTMFSVLTGFEACRDGHRQHPHDISDWWRCEMLLQAVPALRERLALMSNEGPAWKLLVQHWEEIVSTLNAEVPNWRDRGANWTSRTAGDLVRRLIDNASTV